MNEEDILEAATERLDAGLAADEDNRRAGAEDLRFHIGEQWSETDRSEREEAGKPCLTINKVAQFVRQVTGQVRALNPAIKVSPGDNGATKDVADIYEGLIRQIEYASDATSVYEAAAENAAAAGIGHFRVRTEYADDAGFDQSIVVERIHDPFAVVWDPKARDSTRKDAKWCFVLERMTKDDFEADYPGKQATDVEKPSGVDNTRASRWADGDEVIVAEYFWIEESDETIGQMADGTVISGKDLKAAKKAGFEPVRERKSTKRTVKWAKVSGADVLEGPMDIPGKYIPIVATVGEEIHAGDIHHRSGVIRYAKDAQMLYNFARSTGAEVMMQQPKAPYLVTPKQIQGLEAHWSGANRTNAPWLPYNPDEKAPAPQRIPPPVPSSAVLNEIQLASEDMKGTTGIYDASLGARSNETSGVAINARKEESQNSTSVYADNLVKAVGHAGRIIVAMIPEIYDATRTVRILGEDDQEQLKVVNQLMMSETGPVIENDLSLGKYEVRIGVGPKYTTRRQEAADGMLEFLRAVPRAAEIAPDLIAGSQEWPDAERLAARLKKTVPPELLEQDDKSPEEQQQAQMAAQQAQQQQAEQAELGKRGAVAEVIKAEAEAEEAKADAMKAKAEAAQATGAVNAMIQQQVQLQVQQQMQAILAQMGVVQPGMLPPN